MGYLIRPYFTLNTEGLQILSRMGLIASDDDMFPFNASEGGKDYSPGCKPGGMSAPPIHSSKRAAEIYNASSAISVTPSELIYISHLTPG